VKVVILGCGRVGARLARQLDAEGHKVAIIDERMAAFDRLGRDFKGEMVLGNGIDEGVLRRAGIESADCFAAVTNGDNRNLMASQIAKRIFGVRRVITRLYDPIRQEVYDDLGLESFCPTTLGADLVRNYFLNGVNIGRTVVPDPAAARRFS